MFSVALTRLVRNSKTAAEMIRRDFLPEVIVQDLD
jgi:hypothetical protein